MPHSLCQTLLSRELSANRFELCSCQTLFRRGETTCVANRSVATLSNDTEKADMKSNLIIGLVAGTVGALRELCTVRAHRESEVGSKQH
jgi:hypothetical protein